MSTDATPEETELVRRIQADAYQHLVRRLRLTLPLPPGETPGAADLLRRDQSAIARIAALAPANVVEADVAAQYVFAHEQWKHRLRVANEPNATREGAFKCRAEALVMMREANRAVALLLDLQETRRKLEADPAASHRRARAEDRTIRLMMEALPSEPTPLPAKPNDPATTVIRPNWPRPGHGKPH